MISARSVPGPEGIRVDEEVRLRAIGVRGGGRREILPVGGPLGGCKKASRAAWDGGVLPDCENLISQL